VIAQRLRAIDPVYILFAIVFIDLLGFGVNIPLFPFLGLYFGASPEEITILMGAYSLGQLVGAPLWGRLSDRFGRRPLLMVTLAGLSLSYLLFAFAQTIEQATLARLFGGLMGGNVAVAFAYIADVTTPQTRARGMGLLGAGFGLGFIFGPIIGGLIGGNNPTPESFRTAALIGFVLPMIAVLATWALLPESLTPQQKAQNRSIRQPSRLSQLRKLKGRPALALFMLASLVSTTAFALMETSYALWADARYGLGPQDIGLIYAGVGTVLVLMQGVFIGKITRKLGERGPLIFGLAFWAAWISALALSTSVAQAIVFSLLMTVGSGLVNPLMTSLVSQQAGEAERGAVMGLYQSSAALGRVLGPAVAGVVFSGLGPNAPFWLAAALMAVCLPFAITAISDRPARPAFERE
jgi:MFS transporter, DHA1 family, tetracycline resistance protein